MNDLGFRIGFGYDVHKLTKNRDLILGGVKLNYELGLYGHSDADVLVHAIIDSLLGAACLGDIGTIFPDSDPKFKNISSLKLLFKTTNKLYENNFKIINIDSTIVAEKPKILPYINDMKNNISKECNILVGKISIKATTEETLGFTGNLKGIKAYATCLICKF